MKRNLVFGAVLCALFFAASPALAVITVTLENPGDGQDISGIGLVSGWAFSDTGADVTVRPRIDGETGDEIPCCGPRQDVVDAISGAPLNSGFGLLFNYGLLSAGPHTIGVEISAPGEDTVTIDHAVMIARPGDAEFLTSFSLADANVAIDGNEIVIAGVDVGSSSETAKTNLRVSYSTSSQSLVITEAFNENAALFNNVQNIFTNNCAFSGCHAGPNAQQGQNLSEGQSFQNVVAARSMEVPSLLRVNPGRPDQSYLLQKVEGTAAVGERMPLGGVLSSTDISTIRNWIMAGAPPPGGSSSSSSGGSSGGGGGVGGY